MIYILDVMTDKSQEALTVSRSVVQAAIKRITTNDCTLHGLCSFLHVKN